MNKILIIQHYQNDFVLPSGALYVPNAEKIYDFINEEIPKYDLVIPVHDWHTEDHVSFKEWPKHCVQSTAGAMLYGGLRIERAKNVLPWYTGYDPKVDCYSAFKDNGGKPTYLYTKLRHIFENEIEIYITGVATDICVEATALDSKLFCEFPTHVFQYGIAGLNKADESIERMKENGIIIL